VNVYLVGMMGSGKTTVGRMLAEGLGAYRWMDLDQFIEGKMGKTAAQVHIYLFSVCKYTHVCASIDAMLPCCLCVCVLSLNVNPTAHFTTLSLTAGVCGGRRGGVAEAGEHRAGRGACYCIIHILIPVYFRLDDPTYPSTHIHIHNKQMQTFVQTVVSTGGGIMQRRENLPFLHSGLIVWLDLPPDGIVARMQESGEIAKRPLLANVRSSCVWEFKG
jgi:shikimate kinase